MIDALRIAIAASFHAISQRHADRFHYIALMIFATLAASRHCQLSPMLPPPTASMAADAAITLMPTPPPYAAIISGRFDDISPLLIFWMPLFDSIAAFTLADTAFRFRRIDTPDIAIDITAMPLISIFRIAITD